MNFYLNSLYCQCWRRVTNHVVWNILYRGSLKWATFHTLQTAGCWNVCPIPETNLRNPQLCRPPCSHTRPRVFPMFDVTPTLCWQELFNFLVITRKLNFGTLSCPPPPISSPSSSHPIYSHPSKYIKMTKKTPGGSSSYRHGCGRPHTWQPGAPGWKQRQAGDTRAGCGRQGRTDRSRHSHSQAEKQTQTYRMWYGWK